jgi:hypothetical protein
VVRSALEPVSQLYLLALPYLALSFTGTKCSVEKEKVDSAIGATFRPRHVRMSAD